MSETAAAVSAPTETHTSAAPVSPETTGVTPTAPSTDAPAAASDSPRAQSSAEVRQSLKDRLLSKLAAPKAPTVEESAAPVEAAPVAEPKVDAQGRLHGPDGKFVPAEGTPEAAGAVEAPAETRTEAAADEVPAGFVRVEIHPDHPLRHRIGDHAMVPEAVADLVRWANNAGPRSTEVQSLREEVIRLKAQVQTRDAVVSFEDAYTQQLRDNGLAALADEVVEGRRAKFAAKEGEQFQTLQQEQAQTEAQEAARTFVSRAYQTARGVLPPELAALPQVNQALEQARTLYGSALEAREAAGQFGTETPEEFAEYFRTVLLADRTVQGVIRQKMAAEQEAERQRIAREAEEQAKSAAAAAERARLEAASQRHSTKHPLGSIPSHVRTDRQSVSTEVDLSQVPPHQRRSAIKQALGFRGR